MNLIENMYTHFGYTFAFITYTLLLIALILLVWTISRESHISKPHRQHTGRNWRKQRRQNRNRAAHNARLMVGGGSLQMPQQKSARGQSL